MEAQAAALTPVQQAARVLMSPAEDSADWNPDTIDPLAASGGFSVVVELSEQYCKQIAAAYAHPPLLVGYFTPAAFLSDRARVPFDDNRLNSLTIDAADLCLAVGIGPLAVTDLVLRDPTQRVQPTQPPPPPPPSGPVQSLAAGQRRTVRLSLSGPVNLYQEVSADPGSTPPPSLLAAAPPTDSFAPGAETLSYGPTWFIEQVQTTATTLWPPDSTACPAGPTNAQPVPKEAVRQIHPHIVVAGIPCSGPRTLYPLRMLIEIGTVTISGAFEYSVDIVPPYSSIALTLKPRSHDLTLSVTGRDAARLYKQHISPLESNYLTTVAELLRIPISYPISLLGPETFGRDFSFPLDADATHVEWVEPAGLGRRVSRAIAVAATFDPTTQGTL